MRSSLILASGSATRRTMLETAGVTFSVAPAEVDERGIRDRLLASDATIPREAIAEELAIAKALDVSGKNTDAYVIGSDQILALRGEVFEKPRSLEEARASLMALRSRTHELHASVALAMNRKIVWRHTSTARLSMRNFAEEEVDRYLARVGEDACTSVGAYKIEGPAITLFDRIEGDHWTILGMPLLPLLAALRAKELLP